MIKKFESILKILASLNITIIALIFLMMLIFIGTLDQVNLGIYQAQKKYFQSYFLYWHTGDGRSIPVFPSALFITLILLVNLIAALCTTIALKKRNTGLIIMHLGLLLLLWGGGVTNFRAKESQMPIEEGHTKNYSESIHETELVLVDRSAADRDTVISIPKTLLKRQKIIDHEKLPFSIRIKGFFENTALSMRSSGIDNPHLPAVTQGIGTQIAVRVLRPFYKDDMQDNTTAFIEIFDQDKSLGTWLLARVLGAGQTVNYGGTEYELYIRPKRYYTEHSLKLKDFKHDLYPGTEIPKNYSSLVELHDPQTGERRDVLIYMNHPLRFKGKTYYQASFGKNDTLSIFQVVENPGWLLPYISCAMITIGLLIHFVWTFAAFTRKGARR